MTFIFKLRLKPALQALTLLFMAISLNSCEMLDQTLTPMFMMSPTQEMEFSKQVNTEVEKGVKLVNDPTILNFVRRVGANVTANAPQKSEVPAQFFVIENKEINAFAVPGGHIYVHTGLINAAEDEAELASVMAHEYGHVVYRHGARHMSRAMGLDMVQQVVVGDKSGAATQLLAQLVSQGVMTKYSREDELQADSIAVPTLSRASYDPNAMVTFFQTLKTKYGDTGGGIMTYFASHPATSDRIDRVKQQIGEMQKKDGSRPLTDLRKAQARLQDLGLGG